MTLALSPEAVEYADTLRRITFSGNASDAWRSRIEHEAAGLGIPLELGGASGSIEDVVAVMEVVGERLLEETFAYSTAWAAQTLLPASNGRSGRALLQGIASGDVRVAMAIGGTGSTSNAALEATSCWAIQDHDVWRLTGSHSAVRGTTNPTHLLVVATTRNGAALFAVSADSSGVSLAARPLIDELTFVFEAKFVSVECDMVTPPKQLPTSVNSGLRAGTIAHAALELGGAVACLTMTLEHAHNRQQFGVAIGAFQAVKHRLVDVSVQIECARTALLLAVSHLETSEDDLRTSCAKAQCSRAYQAAAATAVQVHGAIGFCLEHPAARHFRRAAVTRELFGTPEWHMARVASLMNL